MAAEPVLRIDGKGALRLLFLVREIACSPRPTTGAERRVAAFLDQLGASRTPTLAYSASPVEQVDAGASTRAVWRRLPLGVRGLRRDLARIFGALSFVARHLRSIRRFGPSVVLERARYLDPTGALIARLLGIPHVLELHGDLAADAERYYASPLAGLGRAYERRRYRAADEVIVVSRGL
ncbi:MAG TPA: glycosyltransferase, partial [Gaiellaceae bacterium]|nr:glycosyltransferase [Gaiellaceae bacterium]